MIPANQAGGGGFSGAVLPVNVPKNLTGDDGDAEKFFQRSLERGGVLIVVEPSDEEAFTQAKRILEEQGAQVLSS